MGVQQLGYLGIRARDVSSWRKLLVDELGCQLAEASSSDSLRVRTDERCDRIRITSDNVDVVDYLGFEVGDAHAYELLLEKLRSAGYDVVDGTPEELTDRHVLGLAHTTDPAGYRIELYHGPTVEEKPFASALGISGFVSGPLGLGHVVIATSEFERTMQFYSTHLGFAVSDHIMMDGMEAVFMRCNARHHTLALLRQSSDNSESEFHHFMLEVPDLDSVGRAHDACVGADRPLSFTLGRHTNDHMVSFYVRTPSGFDIEFGTGGRLVDEENWQIDQYKSISYWGHRSLIG